MNLELSGFSGTTTGFGRKVEVSLDSAGLLIRGLSVREAQMVVLMVEKVSEKWADKDLPALLAAPDATPAKAAPAAKTEATTAAAPAAEAAPVKRGPGRPPKAKPEEAPAPAPVKNGTVKKAAEADLDDLGDDEAPFDVSSGPPIEGGLPADLKAAEKLSQVVQWCMDKGADSVEVVTDWIRQIGPQHPKLSRHDFDTKILPLIPRQYAELTAAASP